MITADLNINMLKGPKIESADGEHKDPIWKFTYLSVVYLSMLKGPKIESVGCEHRDVWQREHAMCAMPPKEPSRCQAT